MQYASVDNATNCTTMETSKNQKSQAFTATIAPEDTPCVFGLDDRDEGEHCVEQHEYGSFGWCWTKKDRSEWGSCGGTCPLVGKNKILGDRIGRAEKMMKKLTSAVYKVISKFKDEPSFCMTVGTDGKLTGNKCVFPFKYNSDTYDSCTDVDAKTGKWCYTEVDENGIGKKGQWGTCSESC